MTDDITHELQIELAKEKQKIFFKKYKYVIISFISVVLLFIVGFFYLQYQQDKKNQQAADDYYKFKEYYSNIESLTDVNMPLPKLLPETIQDVSVYYPMSQLIRFNNARKHDASVTKLLKITNEYLNNAQDKSLTIHDSLLKLFHLSLLTDKVNFETIEPQFIAYIKHPFAFKAIAYEMLFLLAINEKNVLKSDSYLNHLKNVITPDAMNKIKIYETHPLLRQRTQSVKLKKIT